jgi:hypothetical protein
MCSSRYRFQDVKALTIAIVASAAISFIQQLPALSSVPDFAEGQEWLIKSIPAGSAKAIIGRIEPWRDKIAIHISIVDIPAPREAGGLRISQIAHAPIEKSAFAASVDRLVATGVAPSREFEAGYKQWKEHSGGIYTVRVAQVLELARAIQGETSTQ